MGSWLLLAISGRLQSHTVSGGESGSAAKEFIPCDDRPAAVGSTFCNATVPTMNRGVLLAGGTGAQSRRQRTRTYMSEGDNVVKINIMHVFW